MKQEEGLVRELSPCTCLGWLEQGTHVRAREQPLTSTGIEGRDTLSSKVNCNRDPAVTASVRHLVL